MFRRTRFSSAFQHVAGTLIFLLAGVALTPGTAHAFADRRCVCTGGSGGCFDFQYFCCDFNGDHSYNCGCVTWRWNPQCTNQT